MDEKNLQSKQKQPTQAENFRNMQPSPGHPLANDPRYREDLKAARAASSPFDHDQEEGFESPEAIAVSRSERGFRRGGIFIGPEKTLVPRGHFKTREAWETFKNERMILVSEVSDVPKAMLDGAVKPSQTLEQTFPIRTVAHAGSTENATPEMLAAAEEGKLIAHPSLGNPVATGGGQPPQAAKELEALREKASAKKAEK